jgi:ApbE superfamily uncharacterized protein (UPF0280 family)
MSAVARMLSDGRRLHLHHGPIDMIVEAWGPPGAVTAAYRAAVRRFDGLLEELVAELPALRSPEPGPLRGPVARAMAAAVAPYRPAFVTPMAAVAGADADAILAAMIASGRLTRAYVNNGGDIALHLAPGERLAAAIAVQAGIPDRVEVTATSPVRGVATSGWRGRSWSFGIADAVTVLARTAAEADAAATMVANAVDLPGHPAVTRRPALELQADSDLSVRLVTTAVAPLSTSDAAAALDRGLAAAERFRARGLLHAAALFLQGDVRLCGPFPAALPEKALA